MMIKDIYSNLGNILIVGSGPVAINIAINLSKGFLGEIGMVARESDKTISFLQQLKNNDFTIMGNASKRELFKVEGSHKLEKLYIGHTNIDDIWETMVLCVPCDCYVDILKKIDLLRLTRVKTIILVSPEFGSSIVVSDYLNREIRKLEIISLSNYFGATKYSSSKSLIEVTTKALKKKIYIGSSLEYSYKVQILRSFLKGIGVISEILNDPLEVESRNITIFVHPAFLINDVSLNQVFDYDKTNKYVYKLYPEGPITMNTISIMRSLWKEICEVYIKLRIKPINLLKFLNDDNYPVLEESISRENIDKYMEYDSIKQEYLLYVRYSSILIDPFSIPDKNGRYFEFSRIPYPKIYKDNRGKWNIPRMPFEDYKKIKLLHAIGKKLNINMENAEYLIDLFNTYLNKFIEDKGENNINSSIFEDHSINNAKIIIKERLNESR